MDSARTRMYRTWTNAWTQITLVSLVCFCLPGMYNAISGMGGSGQLDPTVGANASVALLSVGAATAVLVGQPVFRLFGVRTILIGGWTYALYTGSLLNYNHTHDGTFVIASGAILGLGAAFLWITQGAIMLAYPLPHQKGRSALSSFAACDSSVLTNTRGIALFWIIFNLGGAIGSFISLDLNYHRTSAGAVSDSTYVAYLVIMLVGWVACVGLVPSHLVVRSDGSCASAPPTRMGNYRWGKHFYQEVVEEIKSLVALKDEWRIWFLVPMCFAANFFYSYQQNMVNGLAFDLRSRSLNSGLYWSAQMVGGLLIGLLLDMPKVHRPTRALIGWIFVFATGNAIMGGGFVFEAWLERQGRTHFLDFATPGTFTGPCFLYFFYGMYDSFWQGYTYWLLGALCDTPGEAARFVAVYKTMQSVGGAVAYRLTANHLSTRKQFISNWCVVAAALVIALPAVLRIDKAADDVTPYSEKTHHAQADVSDVSKSEVGADA